MAFPQFANLPAEIQLQIWESTTATLPATPQMHIFDVRAPSPPSPPPKPRLRQQSQVPGRASPSPGRVRKSCSASPLPPPSSSPRRRRKNLPLGSVTLEGFRPERNISSSSGSGSGSSVDLSAYKFRDVLRATCVDAADAVARLWDAVPAADRAVVELPDGRRVAYDNARDVLHLRFLVDPAATDIGAAATTTGGLPTPPPSRSPSPEVDCRMEDIPERHSNADEDPVPPPPAPLTALFQSSWSPALATALHAARRVAIDVGQIWPSLAEEQHRLVRDVVFLACTMQHDLEVLYLVDYSGGGSSSRLLPASSSSSTTTTTTTTTSSGPSTHGNDLMSKTPGSLYERFHCPALADEAWEKERARPGDVIRGGCGAVWREVFDLEALGWHERHAGFVFGEVFGEVVRLQQGNWFGEGGGRGSRAAFKGVRVLVAEE